MKPTYVYFLAGKNDHADFFKIGLSINPFGRQSGLDQEIDLDRSVCVGYTPAEARENEKWLHSHFANFRIHSDEIGSRNGCTEWFSMECFDHGVEILKMNPGMTGLQSISRKVARMNVDISGELHLALKLRAIKERKSIKELVLGLITNYVHQQA